MSAVYGSDAISGVVNYILNKKFEGLETRLNGGVSDYGDADKYNAAIAAGASLFDGRGHVEVSYEYRKEEGISSRSERPYMNLVGVAGSVAGTASPGTAANPYEMYTNVRQAQYPFGGDGGYYDSSLLAPLEGHQFFGRFQYDFTDTLQGYVQICSTT